VSGDDKIHSHYPWNFVTFKKKMKSFKIFFLLGFLIMLNACKQGDIVSVKDKQNENLSGSFTVGGAYALYPLMKKWSDDFMKIHPDVRITVTGTGTGQGIDDLVGKKIDLAMISRPLTDEELSDSVWVIPVAKEGVAPIVNQKNPYLKHILSHGINPQKFIRLYSQNQDLTWGELLDTVSKEKAVVYTRGDESGAAVVWANFLWKESHDLNGKKVTGDEEMIKSIQADKYGLGYCNFAYAFTPGTGERTSDIQVVPIDLDFDKAIDRKEVPFSNIGKAHRGLWLGYYPKNLTRELTIGSIGKPSNNVILAFIDYALTTGQNDVASSGFCELNDIYVENARDRLK
jgi:phosphate transport system substrate-binding protein